MSVKNEANNAANSAKGMARAANQNPWIERMTRIGYAVRGIIYGLMGWIAIQAIFAGKGQITNQQGVLATIASKPFGKYLLILIAVGLLGLFIWGIIRAIADPYRQGSDAKGIIARLGYLVSGLAYGALLFATINLLRGRPSGGQAQIPVTSGAGGFLSQPWVFGLIGLIILGAGIYDIYAGLKVKFNTRFQAYKMTAEERRWAIRMGRFGTAALGVVLSIIGILMLSEASRAGARKIPGFDQALLFLLDKPYGPYLVGLVALGLIAFAIYSIMGAMWFRIRTAS